MGTRHRCPEPEVLVGLQTPRSCCSLRTRGPRSAWGGPGLRREARLSSVVRHVLLSRSSHSLAPHSFCLKALGPARPVLGVGFACVASGPGSSGGGPAVECSALPNDTFVTEYSVFNLYRIVGYSIKVVNHGPSVCVFPGGRGGGPGGRRCRGAGWGRSRTAGLPVCVCF